MYSNCPCTRSRRSADRGKRHPAYFQPVERRHQSPPSRCRALRYLSANGYWIRSKTPSKAVQAEVSKPAPFWQSVWRAFPIRLSLSVACPSSTKGPSTSSVLAPSVALHERLRQAQPERGENASGLAPRPSPGLHPGYESGSSRQTTATAKARAGRLRCASGAPRSAGLVAARASALRPSDSSQLSERSERSERSEFCDGPQDRAPEGSRRNAPTAPAAHRSLPARAFVHPPHRSLPARAFVHPTDSPIKRSPAPHPRHPPDQESTDSTPPSKSPHPYRSRPLAPQDLRAPRRAA